MGAVGEHLTSYLLAATFGAIGHRMFPYERTSFYSEWIFYALLFELLFVGTKSTSSIPKYNMVIKSQCYKFGHANKMYTSGMNYNFASVALTQVDIEEQNDSKNNSEHYSWCRLTFDTNQPN